MGIVALPAERSEERSEVVNELASEPWASLLCRPNGVRS